MGSPPPRRPIAWLIALAFGLLLPACERDGPPNEREGKPRPALSAALSALQPRVPRTVSSETIAFERSLQARKLTLQPERAPERRLAFGRGVLGQLRSDELRVLDVESGQLLGSQPLEGARLVITLADGNLLALGARQLLRFDASNKTFKSLARPVLLPGSQLHPDAQAADRIWTFDGAPGESAQHPKLASLLLDPARTGILLPDREVELEATSGGVLGTTREGVWLYLKQQQGERFGPGGARLAKLRLPELPELHWVLPARRLDQAYLLSGKTRLLRALVSPTFKELGSVDLAGAAFSAAVADEGRLLAVVVVTGEGPRFELELLDADLKRLALVPLPSEAPTGAADWVKTVTQNQGVVAAWQKAWVAVGGPDRARVFDARGGEIFSIPSR